MTGNWESVLQFDKNSQGKDFVCGDIHGCFDELESELAKIGFNKTTDRLFCVGDLIDRGPKSELAINYVTSPWFFSTMGNHEDMLIMAYINVPDRYDYLNNHIVNGGKWAYKRAPGELDALLKAVEKLPLVIRVGDVLITHAALPPVKSLEEIERNPASFMKTILWFRGNYPPVKIPGISKVYVGHTIIENPQQIGKYINIDTGAFLKHWEKKGKLTILEL